MTTTTLTLLVIYLACILGILGFLAIFFISVKPFKDFSPLIMPIFKGFMIVFVIVAIFGREQMWILEKIHSISRREREVIFNF